MSRTLLLLGFLLAGCTSAPITPGPTPLPTALAAAIAAPIVLTGPTSAATPPFPLVGGIYRLDWAVTAPAGRTPACFYQATIRSVATVPRAFIEDAGAATLAGLQSGTTMLYQVPPGRYYAKVFADCPWRITIQPSP